MKKYVIVFILAMTLVVVSCGDLQPAMIKGEVHGTGN